jgi:uncharacterized repeat protein (TIGR03803 family)
MSCRHVILATGRDTPFRATTWHPELGRNRSKTLLSRATAVAPECRPTQNSPTQAKPPSLPHQRFNHCGIRNLLMTFAEEEARLVLPNGGGMCTVCKSYLGRMFHLPFAAAVTLCLALQGLGAPAPTKMHVGKLTTIATFVPINNDNNPQFGVLAIVPGAAGSVYVAVQDSLPNKDGGVYRITPSGTLSAVHVFDDAEGAITDFLLGPDHNFYGATSSGGAFGKGVFFRMSPMGALTIVHSFGKKDDGVYPTTYTLGHDGCFYGATGGYAPEHPSIAYKISPKGAISVLHRFQTGAISNVCPGRDGGIFGLSTTNDLTTHQVTFFALAPSGKLTTVHTFTSQEILSDSPYAMIEGRDGNYYGISQDMDSVFKVAPSGTFTTLYSMANGNSEAEGACPVDIEEGQDGALYGVDQSGGIDDNGTLFKVSKAGQFKMLHVFKGVASGPNADGSDPSWLMLGMDGDFYGIVGLDPKLGGSAVFRITPAGTFALVFVVGPDSDGTAPGNLSIEAPNNVWYGTSDSYDGVNHKQVLWKLKL